MKPLTKAQKLFATFAIVTGVTITTITYKSAPETLHSCEEIDEIAASSIKSAVINLDMAFLNLEKAASLKKEFDGDDSVRIVRINTAFRLIESAAILKERIDSINEPIKKYLSDASNNDNIAPSCDFVRTQEAIDKGQSMVEMVQSIAKIAQEKTTNHFTP